MRSAKKLLALLLAVSMLLTLCACGKVTHKKLNGEWTLTATPAAMKMDQIFPFEGFTYDEKFVVKAIFKDGVLDLYTDGMGAWVENMVTDLYRWIQEGDNVYVFFATIGNVKTEAFRADCAAEGISREDLLRQFTSEITEEQLVAEVMDGLGNTEKLTHTYTIDGNCLIFDGGAVWTIDVSKDKIIVTEIAGENSTLAIGQDGMVFTR